MRTLITTIGFILVMVLLITFSVKNSHHVELTYFGLNVSCPAYLLVLIPFFLGVICGNMLDIVKRFKLKNEIRRLRRELEKIERPDFQ